jgi:hypothetical protein
VGAMITIQGGDFQAISFTEIVDPVTGRGRLRPVEIDTESYRVARDYMVRLGPKDFVSEEWVARLAESAGLAQPEFLVRFAKFAS